MDDHPFKAVRAIRFYASEDYMTKCFPPLDNPSEVFRLSEPELKELLEFIGSWLTPVKSCRSGYKAEDICPVFEWHHGWKPKPGAMSGALIFMGYHPTVVTGLQPAGTLFFNVSAKSIATAKKSAGLTGT